MALRILHLVSYPLYSGPLPSTLGLALAQRELGHAVSLAYDTKRGAFNDFEEAAAPWIEGRGLDPPARLTLSAKSSPLEYLDDVVALRRLLARGELDVVHVHLSHDHGLAAASGNGRGRALRVRTFHAERSLVPRLGQGWLTRRADGWIVRCRAHAERLAQLFVLPPARIACIPGGIDSARFSPATEAARAAARRRFGLPPEAPLLVHAALINKRGQEELLAAAVEQRDLHLLFAGRGEEEEVVQLRARELGLAERAHFAGYLQGEALSAAYAAADAAFVAQPGNDASARAALEAMASGLPVLAVEVGALAELVDARVGYPLADRRPATIAAGLAAWLADRGEGRARGAAARERVARERSFAVEAAATVDFYAALLSGRTPTAR